MKKIYMIILLCLLSTFPFIFTSFSQAESWKPSFSIDLPVQDTFSCAPRFSGPGCQCPPENTVDLPSIVSFPYFPITQEGNTISSSLSTYGPFGDFYITDADWTLNGSIDGNLVDFTLDGTGRVTNEILPELFEPVGSITIRYEVNDAARTGNQIIGRFSSDIQIQTDPSNCVDMRRTQQASGAVKIKILPNFMITFDDGPLPELTEFVFAALREITADDDQPIRAGFFMVGDDPDGLAEERYYYAPFEFWTVKGSVRDYPEIVKAGALLGHIIGNHTQHHAWFRWPWFDTESVKQEIIEAEGELSNALGTSPSKIFRPPYLVNNEKVIEGTSRLLKNQVLRKIF
jgi:hypothetical protein